MRGSEFAELRAFVTIVEQGSFARAAATLRVAPSTLSQTIRELEARLAAQLLARTTRSVSMTDAGRRLYARFKPAMDEMEAALFEVRNLQGGPKGTVRVHTPRWAYARFIEPILSAFAEAHPDIALDLTVDDAVTNIVGGGFDLGIRLGKHVEQDMVAVRLGGEVHQIAVASPEYIDRHGRPAAPADLQHHRCINWRQPGGSGLHKWEFNKNGRWFAVAVEGALIVSDRDIGVRAALCGIGIAYWVRHMMSPLIDQGRLVPLLEAFSPPLPGWHLYYPKQRHMPAVVRAFVDFVRKTRTPVEAIGVARELQVF